MLEVEFDNPVYEENPDEIESSNYPDVLTHHDGVDNSTPDVPPSYEMCLDEMDRSSPAVARPTCGVDDPV